MKAAQLGIELTENLQQIAVADELEKATEGVQEEAGCSEANASVAHKGNTDSLHIAEIVNIESSTSSDSGSTPVSFSTSSSTSSDMDDIPLNRVYENLSYPSQTGSESANIDLSLSHSQTTTKTYEPSIIQGLINHYSGELPGYETNLERASDACDCLPFTPHWCNHYFKPSEMYRNYM